MGERGDEKTAWGTASGKINVEGGAEGVLAREKHGTTKTGGDTIQKLAETDPKSALRLPKWAAITMAKEKQ